MSESFPVTNKRQAPNNYIILSYSKQTFVRQAISKIPATQHHAAQSFSRNSIRNHVSKAIRWLLITINVAYYGLSGNVLSLLAAFQGWIPPTSAYRAFMSQVKPLSWYLGFGTIHTTISPLTIRMGCRINFCKTKYENY